MSTDKAKVIRLSINLAPDVAEVLLRRKKAKGISITEAIRRAIAVWDFVETEKALGHRLALIECDGDKERVREIVLVD